MNKTFWSRRILALAAAYMMGLQVLLLPLSMAIGGTPIGALCRSSRAAGSTQTPASHQTACPCAAGCGMLCGLHAASMPPQISVVLAALDAAGLLAPAAMVAIERPVLHSPQRARAPPVA